MDDDAVELLGRKRPCAACAFVAPLSSQGKAITNSNLARRKKVSIGPISRVLRCQTDWPRTECGATARIPLDRFAQRAVGGKDGQGQGERKEDVTACQEQGRGHLQGALDAPQVGPRRTHLDGVVDHLRADVSERGVLRSAHAGARVHERRPRPHGVGLRHGGHDLLFALGHRGRQVPHAHARVGGLHRHRGARVRLRHAAVRPDLPRPVRAHGRHLHPHLVGHALQGHPPVLRGERVRLQDRHQLLHLRGDRPSSQPSPALSACRL